MSLQRDSNVCDSESNVQCPAIYLNYCIENCGKINLIQKILQIITENYNSGREVRTFSNFHLD